MRLRCDRRVLRTSRCLAVVGAGNVRLGHVAGVSSLGLLIEATRTAIIAAEIEDYGAVCRGFDEIYGHLN